MRYKTLENRTCMEPTSSQHNEEATDTRIERNETIPGCILFALFFASVKTETYKRYLKSIEGCFTGTSAVLAMISVVDNCEFINERPTFYEALELLNSFLQSHLIEDVKGRWKKRKFRFLPKKFYRFPMPNSTQRRKSEWFRSLLRDRY
ncbi:DEP domain-containing protein 1B-like [Styela clava]